eukprot:gene14815-14996_t
MNIEDPCNVFAPCRLNRWLVTDAHLTLHVDVLAALLDKAADGKALPPIPTSDGGNAAATKSIDTLTNLSAYLTLYRAEKSAGFDPSSVGMSEAEAANIALVFGQ